MRREFRWGEDTGAFAFIELRDDGTAWYVRTIARLKHAGYERWFEHGDETAMRRWLRGRAEQRRELEFFHALGPTATPARWPRRSSSSRPKRNLPRSALLVAIEAASASPVEWDDWSLGVERTQQVGDTCVSVSVFGDESRHERTEYLVVASGTCTTKPTTPRAITRALRSNGFSAGYPAYPWTGSKKVRTAHAAAREAARIFEKLRAIAPR